MKAVVAIKKFFTDPANASPSVGAAEFQALAFEDRQELGRLCCIELSEEFEPTARAS